MIQSFDKERKVLVLGGSGFIGMHLVMNLENEGYLVWNFDLNKSILRRENYLEGDILDSAFSHCSFKRVTSLPAFEVIYVIVRFYFKISLFTFVDKSIIGL
jgi:nucleoside-diphosphate-sugar epimerase